MAIIRLTTIMEKWMRICATAILFLILLAPLTTYASEFHFAKLQERLIADGIDTDLVRSVYQNPLVKLELEVVAANLVRSEATLNYDQFLSKYSVHKAKRYIERHGASLEEANRRFGVEPPVVVAVLMVETALGTYPGKYQTINVLSTMAVSQEESVREKIFADLTEEQKQMQSRAVRSKRLTKRASRSYRELKAVLNYAHKNDIDPFAIVGSSEGAIGIPQFLPSNIEHYGRDGDGDGRIDLFNHPDAIASVAFYLRAHRWGRAENAKQKKKVLLYYNRSNYYADTVYTLAQKLNGNKPL
jgi:membrane-bound lytic murein transglycosylase B